MDPLMLIPLVFGSALLMGVGAFAVLVWAASRG